MNARYIKPLLLIVVLLGIVASCGNSSKEEQIEYLMDRADEAKTKTYYSDAIDYHQAIIGLQTEVVQQALYVETNEQLDAWIEILYTNKEALEKLVFSRNDYGLRSSVVDLLTFYISHAENDSREIFELTAQAEANPYDEELLQSILIRFEELQIRYYSELEKLQNVYEESERDFVTAYNFVTAENPLNEDITELREEEESLMEELNEIYDLE